MITLFKNNKQIKDVLACNFAFVNNSLEYKDIVNGKIRLKFSDYKIEEGGDITFIVGSDEYKLIVKK